MIKCLLKVELAKADLTQKELSKLADVRLPTISEMANNTSKHISVENLNNICRVLNCNISDLYIYIPD